VLTRQHAGSQSVAERVPDDPANVGALSENTKWRSAAEPTATYPL
jgi:hypothetical protein